MFSAFFYKEWIKLRLWWTLLAVANFAFVAYIGFRLRYVGAIYDGVVIWSNWIYKGYQFYGRYETVPLLLGLALGILQFLPEVQNHRFRLVLHLPLGEERAMAIHLVVGLLLLSLLVLPSLVLFAALGALYLPHEFQSNFLLTAAPWTLAGYAGYLFTAAALLEASWLRRALIVLLAAAALRLCYQEPFYEGYARLLPGLAAWTVSLFALPLFSAYRYRKGLTL